MTASLQNTLWNRHCLLEKSRTDFLIAQDSARQDLIAVEEALSCLLYTSDAADE